MSCEAGYICEVINGVVNPNEKTLCTDVQNDVFGEGFGNILDGIYCPEGKAKIQNCPAGFFCEDPSKEPQECPKGKFCPTKVSFGLLATRLLVLKIFY